MVNLIPLFLAILILALVTNSYSASYTAIQPPVQLTDTTYHNVYHFAVSKNSYIVWVEQREDNKIVLLLYDGASIIQIAENVSFSVDLQINSNGHVVWENYDNNLIFLYDGADIIQLNDIDNRGEHPKINDNDTVVWTGSGGIFFYDGSQTTLLTVDDISSSTLQINGNDRVTWSADGEIYLYNGSMVTQLTSDGYWDDSPQINDNGYVVWEKHLGHYEVFLYDGSSTIQITENELSSIFPKINDNGYIIWTGSDSGLEEEIYVCDGLNIHQITNNNRRDKDPQINNNDYIVWQGDDGTDLEIYLYDGNNTYQVTDNDFDDYSPQISDDGLLVWLGDSFKTGGGEIYYASIQSGDGSSLSPPTLIQPEDNSEVTSLTPMLSVNNPSDGIDGELTCEFQIDVTNSFDSSDLFVSPEIAVGSDGTATWQPETLSDNTSYYWRVRASDGVEQSDWEVFSFFVNLFNDAPEAPGTTNPDIREVGSVDGLHFYLNATSPGAFDIDQDKLTYTFELYQDLSLTTPLCSGDTELSSWDVPISLDYGTYYYRVRATDEHGFQSPWSSTTELIITEKEDEGSPFGVMEGWSPIGGCFITNIMNGF